MLMSPADPSSYSLYTGGTDQPKCRIFAQTIRGVPAHRVSPHILNKANLRNMKILLDLFIHLVSEVNISFLYHCSFFLTLRIYECNKRCKCCAKMCTNRLVQHGLQVRLQLFKTQNKGWGIRCLDDVAKGSFVCIYAGEKGIGMVQQWQWRQTHIHFLNY